MTTAAVCERKAASFRLASVTAASSRTEDAGHDADAVGEHDALHGVQIWQHEEDEKRQAGRVQRLE